MSFLRISSQFRNGVVALRRMSNSTPPSSTGSAVPSPTEHRVILDNQTLYIGRELAEALGWKPDQNTDGVKLSLHGWEPTFFTITQAGTEQETLSKQTVESGHNKNVQTVLNYLKDR